MLKRLHNKRDSSMSHMEMAWNSGTDFCSTTSTVLPHLTGLLTIKILNNLIESVYLVLFPFFWVRRASEKSLFKWIKALVLTRILKCKFMHNFCVVLYSLTSLLFLNIVEKGFTPIWNTAKINIQKQKHFKDNVQWR